MEEVKMNRAQRRAAAKLSENYAAKITEPTVVAGDTTEALPQLSQVSDRKTVIDVTNINEPIWIGGSQYVTSPPGGRPASHWVKSKHESAYLSLGKVEGALPEGYGLYVTYRDLSPPPPGWTGWSSSDSEDGFRQSSSKRLSWTHRYQEVVSIKKGKPAEPDEDWPPLRDEPNAYARKELRNKLYLRFFRDYYRRNIEGGNPFEHNYNSYPSWTELAVPSDPEIIKEVLSNADFQKDRYWSEERDLDTGRYVKTILSEWLNNTSPTQKSDTVEFLSRLVAASRCGFNSGVRLSMTSDVLAGSHTLVGSLVGTMSRNNSTNQIKGYVEKGEVTLYVFLENELIA